MLVGLYTSKPGLFITKMITAWFLLALHVEFGAAEKEKAVGDVKLRANKRKGHSMSVVIGMNSKIIIL